MVQLQYKIPKDLSDKIVDFALISGVGWFQTNQVSLNRRYVNLNKTNTVLKREVEEFSNFIYTDIGVKKFREETIFGNFLGVGSSGSYVHPHTDPRNKTDWHIRINFLVQKPLVGGNPIIEGVTYSIDEGCSWLNIACLWRHSSEEVEGKRERICLSLGKYVSEEDGLLLKEKYTIGK